MRFLRAPWLRHPLTVSTAATLAATVAAVLLERRFAQPDLALALYLIAYLAGGWYSTLQGLRALRRLDVEVDLLMILAAVGAAVLGYWQEGAVLLFLFSLSNTLQQYAMDRTRQAVTALMDLHPDDALVRRGRSTERVPVSELQIGDLVLVRPGDSIPIDGEVESGRSWVDESAINGESLPVGKHAADEVFAGTFNQNGALEVRVARDPGDTVLARIVKLVEQARAEKAATQEKIERFEQQYARAVIGLTLLAAAVPVALGTPTSTAVYRALTLMVVASPCAVAIAAPSAFLSALSAAARNGLLLKGGRYLERLADVDIVAFDKTGTLTTGRPRVAAVIPVPGHDVETVLTLAARVEANSEHPLAAAIGREAARRDLTVTPADDVSALPGLGVRGTVDGRRLRVGRPRLFEGAEASWLEDYTSRLRDHGQTVVWVGDPEPIGLIALRDELRPDAVAAARTLRAAGITRLAMLTGDNAQVARAIARRLGIDEVYADLLPQQKVTQLEALTRQGTVAMVGDGINDAPALARAHVGVAMGGAGSDVALESADVVLVGDQLDRLPFVLSLGRRSRRVVLQGLGLALGVIGLLIAGALGGVIGLTTGVVGHEGSTVIVVLSGLRLLLVRFRPEGAARAARERDRSAATGRLDAA